MCLNLLTGVELECSAAVGETLEVNVDGDRKNSGGRLEQFADRCNEVGYYCCKTVLTYRVGKVCKD